MASKFFRFLILCASGLLFCVGNAQAECDVKTPFQVLSLSNMKLIKVLEQTLDQECPAGSVTLSTQRSCIIHAFRPEYDFLDVFDMPDGKPVGSILISYTPREGTRPFFITPWREIFPFTPTIFDSDWGYGPPWFHQTLFEQRGHWYRIALPAITSGWIKIEDVPGEEDDGRVISMSNQDWGPVEINNKHYVILGSSADYVEVRDELPLDGPCEGKTADIFGPFQVTRLPLADLYDSACELKIKPAYTRGC